MAKQITLKGVRVHNLKNISLSIPRDKFVVFTGLSGSGKSSLAFDTIYAEGHRRFVESLSSYARMFLGQMDKPELDHIEGLSPAIAIDQKTTSKNPRSTVGTVTEIYDYIRLLYARTGVPHCPECGAKIEQQSVDEILEDILSLEDGTRFLVLSPVVAGKKGMHEKVISSAIKSGFVRIRIDGNMYDLSEDISLDKNIKHDIDVVVDRLVMKEGIRSRLADSVELALKLSGGMVKIAFTDDTPELEYSQNYACKIHGTSIGELSPRMFSFNNPYGACPSCGGLGESFIFSPEKIIPDDSLSLYNGAVIVNGFKSVEAGSWTGNMISSIGREYGFDIHTPIKDYSPAALNALLYGASVRGKRSFYSEAKFAGIIPMIQKRFELSKDQEQRDYYEEFMEYIPCPVCHGDRLKKEALSVTVGEKNISELCGMSVTRILEFFDNLKMTEKQKKISAEILKEIRARLGFLKNVGLEYLTLSRKAGSLSGGEAQRIRLATQIGSALVGVLYILDEPSIGLHQRDNQKLISTFKGLRDVGNTLIVVEHDEETMLSADWIVDIGPGAGVHGGEVVFSGTPEEILKDEKSLTGMYLSGRKKILVPKKRRKGNGSFLSVIGAKENNLKEINIDFPLGTLTCVTGVSGSGKSSLVNSVLYKGVGKQTGKRTLIPGKHERIDGIEHIDKVIAIDQSPIGRNPRSNPATYTGMFTDIRKVFAAVPEAREKGYKEGRFSFNVKGGRCETCHGDGTLTIEMHFLPDVYVTCDVCKGKRYNKETLEIKYKGKTISDILEMTVDEGCEFFENYRSIRDKLRTLKEVGLGYIKIGQSSLTLSGGEAQRVKLATELSKRSTGNTLYILDEPTTGLHADDVDKLIKVLQRLVDAGNTVVVIEHNLDLIKTADYIIDMGPEGGENGGTVIAKGTPEEVSETKGSYTGEFLKKALEW